MGPRRKKPKFNTVLILSIVGVALISIAVFVLLRGSGILSNIPGFVIGALVLVAIGIAILIAVGNAAD